MRFESEASERSDRKCETHSLALPPSLSLLALSLRLSSALPRSLSLSLLSFARSLSQCPVSPVAPLLLLRPAPLRSPHCPSKRVTHDPRDRRCLSRRSLRGRVCDNSQQERSRTDSFKSCESACLPTHQMPLPARAPPGRDPARVGRTWRRCRRSGRCVMSKVVCWMSGYGASARCSRYECRRPNQQK